MEVVMLKKIGLPVLALAFVLALSAPSRANAGVRIGVYVGPPVYSYPAPPPYAVPVDPYYDPGYYPPPAYYGPAYVPVPVPSFGFSYGYRDRGWHGRDYYRGNYRGHESHGRGYGYGYGRSEHHGRR
jgi:hypothetical protein